VSVERSQSGICLLWTRSVQSAGLKCRRLKPLQRNFNFIHLYFSITF